MIRNLLAITIMFLNISYAFAQGIQDSVPELYLKLKYYAEKRKTTFIIYQSIFNTPDADELNRLIEYRGQKNGLVIRNIIIDTKEPFGTSLEDTTTQAHSIIQRLGNALHHRTSVKTIQNLLLFTSGDLTDEFLLQESERLIRNSGYIRDLKISVVQLDADSADVYIHTRDHWTFKTSANMTSERLTWKFTSYNLFGLGHRFSNTFQWNKKTNELLRTDVRGFYQIPSIAGSFLSSTLSYRFEGANREWGLHLDRPFVSSTTNWAGGAYATHKEIQDSIRLDPAHLGSYKLRGSDQGVWLARSFPLKQGQSIEEKSTRIAVSAAHYIEQIQTLQATDIKVTDLLSGKQTTLVSLALFNRTYNIDNYVFQFGEQEDIPSGRLYQLSGGYEHNQTGGKYYASSTLAFGGYLNNGFYASTKFEWSSFIKKQSLSDQVVSIHNLIFSPLLGENGWRTRLFADVNYTRFLNQSYYRPLNLAEERLLPGYQSNMPEGLERFSVNTTCVLFNPLNIIGFRFAPILFVGGGWVADGQKPLFESQPQLVYGGGVAISNEFLAQSDFKIMLAFFPNASLPYKLGSIRAWDYALNDFTSSKPRINY